LLSCFLQYSSDTIFINGVAHTIKINREVVTIRGIARAGEIIVNAHYYSDDKLKKTGNAPFPVSIEVTKLNPYKIVFKGEKLFNEKGVQVPYRVANSVHPLGKIFTDISKKKLGTRLEKAVKHTDEVLNMPVNLEDITDKIE